MGLYFVAVEGYVNGAKYLKMLQEVLNQKWMKAVDLGGF
jgi:hypothetical protein